MANSFQYSYLENSMDRGAWGLQSGGHKESDMAKHTCTLTCAKNSKNLTGARFLYKAQGYWAGSWTCSRDLYPGIIVKSSLVCYISGSFINKYLLTTYHVLNNILGINFPFMGFIFCQGVRQQPCKYIDNKEF